MSPTVHELRNAIRAAVGRFERDFDAQFTKEELAAVANAVGYEVGEGSLPPKSEMRAGIRRQVGASDDEDEDEDETDGGSFVKAELETIAEALDAGE